MSQNIEQVTPLSRVDPTVPAAIAVDERRAPDGDPIAFLRAETAVGSIVLGLTSEQAIEVGRLLINAGEKMQQQTDEVVAPTPPQT